jgi:hypothetical protein
MCRPGKIPLPGLEGSVDVGDYVTTLLLKGTSYGMGCLLTLPAL